MRRQASDEAIKADELKKNRIIQKVRQGGGDDEGGGGMDPKLAAMYAKRRQKSDVEVEWDERTRW